MDANNNCNENKQGKRKKNMRKAHNIVYPVRFKDDLCLGERAAIYSTNQKSNVTQDSQKD
jgi:hypothetical protein